MKRDELQNIWRKGDGSIEMKSSEELNRILDAKMKVIMKKHFFVNFISVSVGIILITLLIYAGIKRSYDSYYMINNIILCIIVSCCVIMGILSYSRMNNNKKGIPLRDWLKYRIQEISKSQKRYPVRCLFAFFMVLPCYLSFFVYFINRPFIEVIHSEQFYPSFLIVFFSGTFSALLAIRNIKVYHQKNLDKLKKLYNELE